MERVLLYLENGEDCLQDNWTHKEAINKLKKEGYKKAYSGRKLNRYGIKVLVGINNKNAVFIEQRRLNGLFNARILTLK